MYIYIHCLNNKYNLLLNIRGGARGDFMYFKYFYISTNKSTKKEEEFICTLLHFFLVFSGFLSLSLISAPYLKRSRVCVWILFVSDLNIYCKKRQKTACNNPLLRGGVVPFKVYS